MTNPLAALSHTLASLVEVSAKSLIAIRSGRVPATATVWSDGEHAVTVAHVMGGAREGEVILPGGESRTAHLVGRDPGTDLALIRVEGGGLPPARFDDSVMLKAGSLALAVGFAPSGPRASFGMVTAVGEGWRTPTGGEVERYLEVDAVLPRGASGGVLLDPEGRVLGINTHALVRGGATIPTGTVRRTVERILAHGDVSPGWLGVGVHRGRLPPPLADEVGQASALVVTNVADDSPAAQAGLLVGDALVKLGAARLARVEDLMVALHALGGVPSTLEVLRGGAVTHVDVTPAVRSSRRRRC